MKTKTDGYVSPTVEAHRAAQEHAAEIERLRAEVRELHETDCGQLREEINHLRASGSLLANQMRCGICGGNLTVLLACPVCGIRYELVNQDVQARHMSKLRVYEQASKLAPPFAAQSFEAVQVALEQRDAASAALERVQVLLEQSDAYGFDEFVSAVQAALKGETK